MTRRVLDVRGFPGAVLLLEAAPEEVRRLTRSVPVPDGWAVSRSYRGHFGIVATHGSRVGVDIELLDPELSREAVLTPSEMTLEGSPEAWCDWWSAKEALAKALGDASLYDPRRLESPARWENGSSGRFAARPLDLPGGLVGWLVWEELAVDRATCICAPGQDLASEVAGVP